MFHLSFPFDQFSDWKTEEKKNLTNDKKLQLQSGENGRATDIWLVFHHLVAHFDVLNCLSHIQKVSHLIIVYLYTCVNY